MDKSSDAFRTISEVAADLDLPQHVLRFWETRFAQIKPLKRGGGRRYYRPDDVDLLKGIRHLLYGEGYTIKGVQRILKDQGVRFVMSLWQEGAPSLDPATRGHVEDDFEDAEAFADEPHSDPLDDDSEDPRLTAQAPFDRPRGSTPAVDPRFSSLVNDPDEGMSPESIAQRFAPRSADAPTSGRPDTAPQARGRTEPPMHDAGHTEWPQQTRQQPNSPMMDRFRGIAGRSGQDAASRAPAQPSEGSPNASVAGVGLSREDVRRLQATLFELLECKRLLDQTR